MIVGCQANKALTSLQDLIMCEYRAYLNKLKSSDILNKNLGCKRDDANQKQQLSDYSYIPTYTCD